jgi:AcrR family transcriptional regulator
MSNEKMDRRKKYTRMVLKDSLMQLLKSKQINEVTVKELCALADINRSTFYSHYSDQYDLLNQIEDEIVEDMDMYLSSYKYEKEEEFLQMTEKLLEYFVTKQEECRTLLNENGETSFQKKVSDVAHRFISRNWMDQSQVNHVNAEYIRTFVVSGSVQMMKLWLYNGMDRSPGEMAMLINGLVNKGLFGVG